MFDVTRRGFLNLLGLGGVALVARPAISLFGSDEAKDEIFTPDFDLVKGHRVVYPKRMAEPVGPTERAEWAAKHGDGWGAQIVARIPRFREPQRPILRREGRFQVRPRLPDGSSIQDAHTAFYVASNEVRESFAAFSRETLSQVDRELRPMATLVTIADGPVHARPVGVRGEDSFSVSGSEIEERREEYIRADEDLKGFDVCASFRQFVIIGADKKELESFQLYSDRGEFPLQVPRDVEMGMLIRMDKEVVSSGETAPDRIGSLLSQFSRNWRSASSRRPGGLIG